MNRKRSQGRFVFFCIAPAAILVTLFIFIPTINVFRMSLYRMGGITNRKEFVGLNNFKTLMGDTNFLQAMQNSIAIIVLVTLCTIFFAIMFGAILHRGKFKGKNFFRIIFYIPNILSIVVIAGIFGAIYNPSTGLLNTFLDAIGLGFLKQQWMGDQNIVLYSIIFALIWQAIGYYMVMYMADLEQYPYNTYVLHYQYDQLKLPVRTGDVQRRTERAFRSVPELHVLSGIRIKCVRLRYGDRCCGLYLLLCTCGYCK